MTTPPEKPALRLGGMALENGLSRPRPGPLGRRRPRRRRHGARRVRGQDAASAPRAPSSASRSCAASPRWPRCCWCCRRSAAALPERAAALRAADPGRRLAAGALATAGARRSGRLSPAAVEALAARSRCCRRCVALRSRNLAALPRRRAQDDRRLRVGRRRRGRPRRSTTAAARTSSARWWPPRRSPTSSSRGCRGATRPRPARPPRSPPWASPSRPFAWMNRHAGAPRGARPRPARPRAPARARHARAGAGPARGRPRGARSPARRRGRDTNAPPPEPRHRQTLRVRKGSPLKPIHERAIDTIRTLAMDACRRRTPGTRARRWRSRRSRTCSTARRCGTTRPTRRGRTATASCSRPATPASCSTPRCTCPATTSPSRT